MKIQREAEAIVTRVGVPRLLAQALVSVFALVMYGLYWSIRLAFQIAFADTSGYNKRSDKPDYDLDQDSDELLTFSPIPFGLNIPDIELPIGKDPKTLTLTQDDYAS